MSPSTPNKYPLPIAVGLGCGMLLAVLSQLTSGQIPSEARFPLRLLLGLGVLSFVVSGLIARFQPNLGLVRKPSRMIGRLFSISSGQVLLLCFAPFFALLARFAAGDGGLAHHAGASVLAWLAAITCAVAGSWRRTQSPPRLLWREWLLLGGLFAGAFLMRGLNTAAIPTTLSGDEASAGLSSLLHVTGEANNWFSIGWFSFPSLFYALQSVTIRLFGQTIEGLRILSALAGAGTIVGLYILARGLFGRITAFIAASFLITQHFHVHFSRIGLQNVWDGLFTTIALSGLWLGWKRGWRTGFIVCGIALGLGQYFYVTFRAMPAIVLLWCLTMAVFQWQTFKQRLPDLILAAFISLLIFAPLGLYFLDHPAEFNAPLQRVTVFEGWLTEQAAKNNTSEGLVILDQILISAQGITNIPLQHWYNVGKPLLLTASATLFVLGLLWACLHFDSRHYLVLLPITIVILAGALSRDAPASQRYVIVAPMAAIFVALPLSAFFDYIQNNWPRYRQLVLLPLIVFVGLLMWSDYDFYVNDVYENYVLGGYNTETAMAIADFVQSDSADFVYFLGWPRMGYDSIASIRYLAPDVIGKDIMDPISAETSIKIKTATTFLILPERQPELTLLQQQFPDGVLAETVREQDGSLYFYSYSVGP